MKKIAIDGYRLVGPLTSVGNYTEELLAALQVNGCEVTLLAPRFEHDSLLERVQKRYPEVEVVFAAKTEAPDENWCQMIRWNQQVIPGLLKECGVDALISTYHQVPLRVPSNVARVGIIHDCCGLRVDCGYRQYGRAWLRHWSNLKASAVFADAIVPISKATHDDFLRLNPGCQDRLTEPIYNQVSREVLNPADVLREIEELQLTHIGYLLAFALPSKRKGTDVALRAYNQYRKNGGNLPLVLMGGDDLDAEAWGLMPEYKSTVVRVGRVTDELRDALYAHAACFLFFSRCEGFGYPIVEAARQGCPVVAWDQGTATELLGDCQPMMKSLDPADGGYLIHSFTALSMSERAQLRQRLIAQSMRFANGETATSFLAAIDKAISHRTRRVSK